MMENTEGTMKCEPIKPEVIEPMPNTVTLLSGEIRKEIAEVDNILGRIRSTIYCGVNDSLDDSSPTCLMDEMRLSLEAIRKVKKGMNDLLNTIAEG